MAEDYLKYIKALHSLFENDFMEAYRNANNKKRRRILPYLQAIHRRWYYATLVEHTPFSPANLSECIADYFKEGTDKYSVAVLRTPVKVTGVDMKTISYSIENHPAIADLNIIINYCTPHIDLYESGCFTDEQALEAAEMLSMNDPHYASFLLELAIWMKMLSKLPSLYVQRMQPSKKCAEILAQADEELLHDIINAVVQMTAFGLQNSIPMPEHIFTESFVRSLLTSPLETDEIFARVFEVLGYDIEDLLDLESFPVPDGLSLEDLDFDMELLSGTFVMGIVLDRFFFTPFGHFLRIIRPMYALPFAFGDEVTDYINVCEDPEEAFVAFFAPCSSYTLTDLGLKLLDIAPNEENYFNASDLNFESMKNTIFADERTLVTFVKMAQYFSPFAMGGFPSQIYTFRIRLESDHSIWMHLHVPDNFTLENLYEEVAHYFNLKNNGEFTFFHDKVENRFAEYPSARRAAKAKNPRTPASECVLSELDFEHMNNLILITFNQSPLFANEPPTIRLTLERLSEKDSAPAESYPAPGRMSKNMKVQFQED